MIFAIIVTYNPSLESLRCNLSRIAHQVDSVAIFDNNSDNRFDIAQLSNDYLNCSCEVFNDNRGLGFAINSGINNARALGAKYILLADQDSSFRPNSVLLLASRFSRSPKDGLKIAAVGPRFIDAHKGGISEHVKFELTRIGRVSCNENQPFVATDFLITSGSLIPMTVLDEVGPMDESLFIDHIDTEWCLRAKSKGYELLGDCEALMEHDLGEYRKRIWFLRWREVPVHKPFRYYYIFRNSVLLYRRAYIPWAWKRIDMIRLVQIVGFTVIFGPQRFQKIRMMLQGVFDGLRGKSGRLDG
ncbi:MAG: hypothetical protein B7Y07_10010 [Halothiobacillus sp. 24-54-40]|nr:MAG: hypothetical protein B7Y58_09080 [Halothiobacillus sp. 35-54-62]OYZ85857.1 MAG: hypothetical protein B7Y07_10010 [Halothiobacillus sp. 24-54-40]OZB48198.1 MAG: hypothetical protein B7X60_04480 [Polynucleobacter sp. 39-45-136]HQS29787.1 glycosyltransferase family 2 protein [Halothiobacillus sp.]